MDHVVDHAVQVDVARTENAVHANMELEFQRNEERFAFLKWGSSAFNNMLVVPPGSGIVHQVTQQHISHIPRQLKISEVNISVNEIIAVDLRLSSSY